MSQILTPIIFRPPYFLTVAIYQNSKQTCQESMIGLSPHQTWGKSVPPTRRTVDAMGTQKGKVESFLYIFRSSGPRRIQHHQCYTTCWGRSCCKKTTGTVPYLPIHPYISQAAKISSPTSVNSGPLISRKLLEIES